MAYTYKKRVNTASKYSIIYPNGNPFSRVSKTGGIGNCTWWAWGRFKEVYNEATGKNLSWTAGAGNAGSFYRIMGKAGYKTGQTPKPGAIICWSYNGIKNGDSGHVAFVEQVYKNGDIEVSQSGYSSGCMANAKHTKSSNYKFSWNGAVFNGFIYNRVEFTNPDGTVAAVSATADHPKSWYINKYGNEARVYFWLIKLGYSHKGTCATMGNISQESNFNTEIISKDGYGSQGLCQWTGDRLSNLKSFAKKNGLSWKTVEAQCKFLDHELQSYKSLRKKLVSGDGKLYDLTYDFCFTFERPAKAYANMTNRSNKAETYYKRYGGAGAGEGGIAEEEVEGSVGINMQQRSSQLYSSANYQWVTQKDENEDTSKSTIQNQRNVIKQYLQNIKIENPQEATSSGAVPDFIPLTATKRKTVDKIANSVLSVADAMIEAPFVELDLGGTIIGSYNNSVDKYPNHISKLEVDKINGEINKYAIELVHQIRAGEDPNLIDKIISKVRYSNIKIKYGDYQSNVIYGDENAIITDVNMNRDYVSSKITYTIYATSAGELVTSHKLNFPAKKDKPSNIINDLLYNNPNTSPLLLDAFPGMKDSSLVNSNNLIPTNDAELKIDEKYNISTIEYINYLVSCMSNISNDVNSIVRNSNYYISYENDFNNKLGGAFFKITEVKKDTINTSNSNSIFEVTVGYPDNNYVMGFNVDNDIAWSLLYENGAISDEYIYSIDDNGQQLKDYSPNLFSSSSLINEVQKNWWTQMVNFPVNASLTLKGLMKPIMLMNYVIVNVVFYGQKHVTSGVYTITGQKDTLSGEGFRTILSLTRVGG